MPPPPQPDLAPEGAYVLDLDEGGWRFHIRGERFREVMQEDTTSLMAKVGLDEYEFIRAAPDGTTLRTWHAGCFPVFYRASASGVRLSNHPHLLFRPGETVEVKAQLVAQQISAQGFQVYDPFTTVEHLEDSAEYLLRRSGFVRSCASFVHDPEASFERVRSALLRRYRAYVEEGRPIAIPLSAGYDSRLTLACLRHVAGGPDRLHAWHYLTSTPERKIAMQVAEHVRTPFSLLDRDNLLERIASFCRDPEYIVQARLARPNNQFQSVHVPRMRNRQGEDALIVGFSGSEAHMGLLYRQVEALEPDLLRVFPPGGQRFDTGLSHLGRSACEDFFTPFLRSTIKHSAEVYDSRTSRLDFVYYHARVCSHMGNRSRYFSERFDARHPRLDPDFLNLVFSLPPSHKEAGAIPRRLIAELDEDLARIPYLASASGRMQSRPRLPRRIAASIYRMRLANKRKGKTRGRKTKGVLSDSLPASVLTAALRDAAARPIPTSAKRARSSLTTISACWSNVSGSATRWSRRRSRRPPRLPPAGPPHAPPAPPRSGRGGGFGSYRRLAALSLPLRSARSRGVQVDPREVGTVLRGRRPMRPQPRGSGRPARRRRGGRRSRPFPPPRPRRAGRMRSSPAAARTGGIATATPFDRATGRGRPIRRASRARRRRCKGRPSTAIPSWLSPRPRRWGGRGQPFP